MAPRPSGRARARLITPLLVGALAVPVLVAAPTSSEAASCATSVNLTRLSHQVLKDKVVIDTFRARVTTGRNTRSATVIRMTMPRGSRPQLLHKPLGLVDSISNQVRAQAPRALTAINGDFFAYYDIGHHQSTILPWSSTVTHGAVLRGFDVADQIVGVDSSGHPYGGRFAVVGTATDGPTSYPLRGINVESIASDGVTVYTRAWYPSGSTPRPSGSVEWVVRHHTITQVWTGGSNGAPGPAGSQVLAFGSSVAATAAKAKVGDPVTLTYRQSTATGVKLREAVGTREAMVAQAKPSIDCRHYDTEARPRTSIGWTARGRWMTLSVPGTGYDRSGYRIGGLDVPEEAAVAARLRFDQAFILDGGGSVTAWARHGSAWQRVDDSNSAWERYVPNGLAFLRP